MQLRELRRHVLRGHRERDPLHGEVACEPPVQRGAVVHLDRHAGALEAVRDERVVELRREEVVDAAVEVVPALDVEARSEGVAEGVDPADHGLVGLVVLRIVVGREERAVVAELVVVEQHQRRVLPHQLDARVGLGLRAGERVAVQVEPVRVAAGVGLAAVGVLHGHEHDDRVVQHARHHAVVAVGELVQGLERGVGAALLVAVDVRHHPQDRRGRGGKRRDLVGRRLWIADLRGRVADVGERLRRHVLRDCPRSRTGSGVPARRCRPRPSRPGRSRPRRRRGRRRTPPSSPRGRRRAGTPGRPRGSARRP